MRLITLPPPLGAGPCKACCGISRVNASTAVSFIILMQLVSCHSRLRRYVESLGGAITRTCNSTTSLIARGSRFGVMKLAVMLPFMDAMAQQALQDAVAAVQRVSQGLISGGVWRKERPGSAEVFLSVFQTLPEMSLCEIRRAAAASWTRVLQCLLCRCMYEQWHCRKVQHNRCNHKQQDASCTVMMKLAVVLLFMHTMPQQAFQGPAPIGCGGGARNLTKTHGERKKGFCCFPCMQPKDCKRQEGEMSNSTHNHTSCMGCP